jgi:hypothetical protein
LQNPKTGCDRTVLINNLLVKCDLAAEKDFAHTFREVYRERGYSLVVPPTGINRSITSLLAGWPFTSPGQERNTIHIPSGEYSGPSSKPGAKVQKTGGDVLW